MGISSVHVNAGGELKLRLVTFTRAHMLEHSKSFEILLLALPKELVARKSKDDEIFTKAIDERVQLLELAYGCASQSGHVLEQYYLALGGGGEVDRSAFDSGRPRTGAQSVDRKVVKIWCHGIRPLALGG